MEINLRDFMKENKSEIINYFCGRPEEFEARENRDYKRLFLDLEGGISQDLISDNHKIFASELICSICLEVARDPKNCKTCQNLFCKFCISKQIQANKCCPNRCNYIEEDLNLSFKKLLYKIQLKCLFFSQGCDQLIDYENFDKHINTCSQGNYICLSKLCSFEGPLKEILLHVSTCPMKIVVCIYCSKEIYKIEYDTHYLECSKKLKKCPYCKLDVMNKEYSSHSENCLEYDLKCDKCDLIFKRKVKNDHTDITCLTNQVNLWKSMYEKVNSENIELKQKLKNVNENVLERFIEGIAINNNNNTNNTNYTNNTSNNNNRVLNNNNNNTHNIFSNSHYLLSNNNNINERSNLVHNNNYLNSNSNTIRSRQNYDSNFSIPGISGLSVVTDLAARLNTNNLNDSNTNRTTTLNSQSSNLQPLTRNNLTSRRFARPENETTNNNNNSSLNRLSTSRSNILNLDDLINVTNPNMINPISGIIRRTQTSSENRSNNNLNSQNLENNNSNDQGMNILNYFNFPDTNRINNIDNNQSSMNTLRNIQQDIGNLNIYDNNNYNIDDNNVSSSNNTNLNINNFNNLFSDFMKNNSRLNTTENSSRLNIGNIGNNGSILENNLINNLNSTINYNNNDINNSNNVNLTRQTNYNYNSIDNNLNLLYNTFGDSDPIFIEDNVQENNQE